MSCDSPDAASFDVVGNSQGFVDVISYDTGRQSVVSGVGFLDRVVDVLELDDALDWTEYLQSNHTFIQQKPGRISFLSNVK
jgi:hypothetical protein